MPRRKRLKNAKIKKKGNKCCRKRQHRYSFWMFYKIVLLLFFAGHQLYIHIYNTNISSTLQVGNNIKKQLDSEDFTLDVANRAGGEMDRRRPQQLQQKKEQQNYFPPKETKSKNELDQKKPNQEQKQPSYPKISNDSVIRINSTSQSSRQSVNSKSLMTKKQKKKEFFDVKFVIFYNAYINPDNLNQSLKIVDEQLKTIRNASKHSSTPFYYNVMGHNLTQNSLCPPHKNDCQQLRYVSDGDEAITLQDAYDYCHLHPNDAIIYLHDKGSFHNTGSNRRIRKIATASAVSNACYDSMKDGKCNLCVNKFKFLPNHHTPGNMWVGNCTYLQTLIPPRDFAARRYEMFRLVRNQRQIENQTTTPKKLYCIQKLVEDFERNLAFNGDQWKYLSLGRYAMEHWAFSGPKLMPCNTILGPLMKVNTNTFQPTTAVLGTGDVKLDFETATTTGWYQLEGRTWEMQYLYKQLPPPSSFIWSTYHNAYVHNATKIRC
mmetsp:Transcript_27771/g.31729  ORF Transcript_27771/g.31729 Transcript_27771/m.31729 type:complete len:489 (+) Transcript_27771:163-1629(+)